MRRLVGGVPFIIKVDRFNGGSSDLVMGYEVLPPGHVIPLHRHPNADEILFVQYGRGTAELGDRTAPVGAGATVYIPHDVRISLRAGPDSLGLVFIFSRPGFEQYLRDVSVLEGQPVVPLSEAERKVIHARHKSHVVYEQP
jgi:oxalate decarboxylase/phosphoglucose isomerase-like protein (cupin superfamily)